METRRTSTDKPAPTVKDSLRNNSFYQKLEVPMGTPVVHEVSILRAPLADCFIFSTIAVLFVCSDFDTFNFSELFHK